LSKVAQLPPALAQGLISSPGDHLDDMHGRRREELLQVRPCSSKVPTLTEIEAPYALREATLHPRPQGILGFERRRLLTLSRALDRLVVGLGPDRELPWGVFRCGAHLTGRTGATGGPVKPAPKDQIARDIVAWGPFATRNQWC